MGVTIKSKSRSIDLGGGGFRRLRTKVAELAAPDIFEHYKKLGEGMWYPNRKAFFKDYDEKSDCDAEMDADHCRSIYEVIKDYDDNILYGYAGRKDCAKFADFKKIVKDGIDSGDGFSWC